MPTTVPPPVVHSIPADDSALSQQEKTRRDICFFLRGHIVGRSLKRGTANLAAVAYNVRERYVRDIWAKNKKSILYQTNSLLIFVEKRDLGGNSFIRPKKFKIWLKKCRLSIVKHFKLFQHRLEFPTRHSGVCLN